MFQTRGSHKHVRDGTEYCFETALILEKMENEKWKWK